MFRRFFKENFNRLHNRRQYAWVKSSLRIKAKEYMFSFAIPQIDENFYGKHEAEFLFFITDFASKSRRCSKKEQEQQFRNFTYMFKMTMLCPTKVKLIELFKLPFIKVLW
jgi:hypothetical protein